MVAIEKQHEASAFQWDRRWHATHPFEDFWSPPRLLNCTSHALSTLTLGVIALAGLAVPAFTGAVEPWLRAHTP